MSSMSSTSPQSVKLSAFDPFSVLTTMQRMDWRNYDIEDVKEQTVKLWFKEAQLVNPEAHQELQGTEHVPAEMLAELYPEIAAFGPNGARVVQAFQLFREVEHYSKTVGSLDVKSAYKRFAEKVSQDIREDLRENGPKLLLSHPTKPGHAHKAIVVCADNARFQTYTPQMECNTLSRVPRSAIAITSLIAHVAAGFVAQNLETKDEEEIRKVTRSLNENWETLRADLSQTELQVDMPYLMSA